MKRLTTVYLVLGAILVFSQERNAADPLHELGEMRSDRPGHVISAYTCGWRVLQLQAGYRFQRYTYTPLPYDKTYTHFHFIPTTLRYGLTQRLEVNAGYEYTRLKYYDWWTHSSFAAAVSAGPLAGLRYTFLKGDKWVPTLALQASFRFKAPKIDLDYGSEFILTTRNDFGKLVVSTSIGLVWWGWGTWQYHKMPNYVPYAVNVAYDFGKLTGFVEAFGDLTWPDLAIDGGLAVPVGSDLVFDFSGGCAQGLEINYHWFAEAGLTYRLGL